jgi:hypothetical protein
MNNSCTRKLRFCEHEEKMDEEAMSKTLELGLDTFGDVTEDDAGHLEP